MHISRLPIRIMGPLGVALGFALTPVASMAQAPAPGYLDYQAMTRSLERLVGAHRSLAKLESIGETRGGRKLWMVQVAGPGPVPAAERPAVFMAANLEGDQLVGGAVTLATLEQLLTGYATDANIKAQLDRTTLYVIPRVNPDGAEAMFAKVKAGVRTNTTPHDDDNDARMDEDGPEDLDGDGWITTLRVVDPEGQYIVDPADPRVMKKADAAKGERGRYKLYFEGIDNDGDGFINEDPPGGVDLNRNFQHEYPYYQVDAGRHMVSELESRAVMDFLIAHRNIAAFYVLGASDNLVTAPDRQGQLAPPRQIDLFNFAELANREVHQRRSPPEPRATGGQAQGAPGAGAPGGGRQRPARPPATTVTGGDRDYFVAVSEKYRELTGLKTLPAVRDAEGALFQFGYYQFGVPSFSTPGWGLPEAERPGRGNAGNATPAPGDANAESGAPAAAPQAGGPPRQGGGRGQGAGPQGGGQTPGAGGAAGGAGGGRTPVPIDAQLAQWLDKEKIDGFTPWKAYKHPELKDVEIGGFRSYAVTNPPVATVTAGAAAQAKFVTHLASLLPRVKVASVEVKNHGGGVYRIKVDIENEGFFPTALAHAVTARAVKPTMVQLDVEPEQVMAGNAKTSFVNVLAGSGGREQLEWVIQGRSGQKIELKVQAQKGGTVVQTVTLP